MIPVETIALVRDRTDIVAVITESVPSLKRRGRSFVGLCPFHKEKTPSFHVNPDRGHFHCFGCGEKGSVFDFVMKQEGAKFHEAVRSLAERVGIVIEEERGERTEIDRQKKQKDDLYAANNVAAGFFEQQLREHPMRQYALDELARRGIIPGKSATVDETLQAFRIGYAPPEWDGLTGYLRAQGISPTAAESVGVIVPRSSGTGHYDRFRQRLMFAVMDTQGRVVAFSGRALPDPPDAQNLSRREEKGPPPKYMNTSETPIYTKGQMLFGLFQARHAIRQEELAVLVEGNFDVVSLHARGLANVVAPLGTAFTIDQAKLLKRFAATVVFLFDGDAAGKKAVRASRDPAREAGLTTKVATLPEGADPDDFVRSKGEDALTDVIKQSKGMLEFSLETLLDTSFASADAFERAARVDQISKLLAAEDDPLVRSMAKGYADQLAARLDLQRSPEAFRALEQKVKKALAEAGPRKAPTSHVIGPQSRWKSGPVGAAFRREIVGALIEFPALMEDPDAAECFPMLEGNSARAVAALAECLAALGTAESSENRLDSEAFIAKIPAEIQGFASERLAAPQHDSIESARATLLINANKLKTAVLSRETTELARGQHEKAGDWLAGTELARETMDRARLTHGVKLPQTLAVKGPTKANDPWDAPPYDPQDDPQDPGEQG